MTPEGRPSIRAVEGEFERRTRVENAGTLIAGGALLVSFVALVLSVASNVRGYSLQQRMLDLERRLGRENEDSSPGADS